MDSVAPAANRFTHLRVEASQRLLMCYGSFLLILSVLLCAADLLLLVKLVSLLIIVAHAVWWLGDHYLLCWQSSVRCLLSDGDVWSVESAVATEEVDLKADYLVTTGLILLRLKGRDSGRNYNVILFSDAGNAEQLRRLRIELRWLIPAKTCVKVD